MTSTEPQGKEILLALLQNSLNKSLTNLESRATEQMSTLDTVSKSFQEFQEHLQKMAKEVKETEEKMEKAKKEKEEKEKAEKEKKEKAEKEKESKKLKRSRTTGQLRDKPKPKAGAKPAATTTKKEDKAKTTKPVGAFTKEEGEEKKEPAPSTGVKKKALVKSKTARHLKENKLDTETRPTSKTIAAKKKSLKLAINNTSIKGEEKAKHHAKTEGNANKKHEETKKEEEKKEEKNEEEKKEETKKEEEKKEEEKKEEEKKEEEKKEEEKKEEEKKEEEKKEEPKKEIVIERKPIESYIHNYSKEKWFNNIAAYLTQKEKFALFSSSKLFKDLLLETAKGYEKMLFDTIGLPTIQAIDEKISETNSKIKKELLEKPIGEFSMTRGAVKAVELLNDPNYTKIYSKTTLDNNLADMALAYRILAILIGEEELAKIEDDGVFWIKFCEFFLSKTGDKPGAYLIETSKHFKFDNKSIYLIHKLVEHNKTKMIPSYYTKFCSTTGLIMFLVKDSLEYSGAIINEKKTPPKRIIENLEYEKSLAEKIQKYLEFLGKL